MKNPIITSAITLVFVIVAFIVANCNSRNCSRFNFSSTEEPFISLTQPFKNVNACLVLDSMDTVIIRIVDATGREVFIAALKDIDTGKYTHVITDPDVQWSKTFKSIAPIRSYNSLAEAQSNHVFIADPDCAITDLINLLDRFRDLGDGGSDIAYDALREVRTNTR